MPRPLAFEAKDGSFEVNPDANRLPYAVMSKQWRLAIATCLAAAAVGGGCASAPSSHLHPTPPGLGLLPYSDADVEFMSGMVPHTAQAVIMAGLAPSPGARPHFADRFERIDVV